MTTQAIPDPMGLKSWEEAFQYPLPTVRKLSIRLRKDIDDHRTRLRSLVGASYRDLLGTAARIVDMDTQIQSVESDLSNIGRHCDSRRIERADTNYAKLERSWGEQHAMEERLSRAARSRMLAAALALVERIIKREEDTLQAAKLMVLSRLLYKSLDSEDSEQPSLDRQRRRISGLRNRLLAYIDNKLCKSSLDADGATNTLSAFALLSSSKLRDVLGHFLAVRKAQLETLSASPTAKVLLEVLALYTDSIQLVQTVFPKRISESLSSLGSIALLSDRHITQATELNLDIYGRWIVDDIRSFRPWVQQDGFPGSEARKDLTAFSTDAHSILLSTLKRCLSSTADANEVLAIRTRVIGAYLGVDSRDKMSGFLEHVRAVRSVFVQHLEELASQITTLDDFAITNSTATPKPQTSIWNLADNKFDLSSGGINLRRSVLRLRHGVDDTLDAATTPLQQWHDRIQSFSRTLESMRGLRWDEYIDDDAEEGEEDISKQFQDELSSEDPSSIEKSLRQGVETALGRAADVLVEAAHAPDSSQPDFLIRMLREYKKREKLARALVKLPNPDMTMHHELTQELHQSLANTVVSKSLGAFERSIHTKQYIATDLWDGTPALPLQPLPTVFRFVMALQRDMSAHGEDIYSGAAVDVLKAEVATRLSPLLLQDAGAVNIEPAANDKEDSRKLDDVVSNDTPEASSDGEKTADQDQTEHVGDTSKVQEIHEQRVQRLFDALYLRHVLLCRLSKSELGKTIAELTDRAKLETNELQRLEKNVSEYWRRTYLLFGLLAPSTSSIASKH